MEFHRLFTKFLVLLRDVVKVIKLKENVEIRLKFTAILFPSERLHIYNSLEKLLAIQILSTLLEKIGMTMILNS